VTGLLSRSLFMRLTLPVLGLVLVGAISFGVLRGRTASAAVLDRSALQVINVESGSMICKVEGLGTLVPEDVRWLAAGTNGHVDEIFLRPGAHVKPETIILQMSNPDLNRQLTDAELAMRKSEAELANLRVQLQAQLLNEKAVEADLQAAATESKLQSDRDESLLENQLGTAMNAKISKAHADALVTRLQIEKEKLGIAEEARQAQLAAKQAEVAQMQALYDLRNQQKEALQVRAGMNGILEEVSVGPGQQVLTGTNLARVTNSARLMARVHISEAQFNRIDVGQAAMIAIQNQEYPARVMHIDPNVQNGTISVDLKFVGAQPRDARSDLSVTGSVNIEKIPLTTFVRWPLQTHADEPLSLYKISDDGKKADLVRVHLGRSSNDRVQIADGLKPGDRIIVSDMSAWRRYSQVELK
jgi:HlyD family secretion protein